MFSLCNQSLFHNAGPTRPVVSLEETDSKLQQTMDKLRVCKNQYEQLVKQGSTEEAKALEQKYKQLDAELIEQKRKKTGIERKLQLFLASEHNACCLYLFNFGLNLTKRKDILSDELIFSVTEEALFAAKDLLPIVPPLNDGLNSVSSEMQKNYRQACEQLQERHRLYEATWNDLCAQREAWLLEKHKPRGPVSEAAVVIKVEAENSKSKTLTSPKTLASKIYARVYDLYSLAARLAKHSEVFISTDLNLAVMNTFVQAGSQMTALGEVSEWFDDYQKRLQSFKQAERRFQDAFVGSFLNDDPEFFSGGPRAKG